MSDHNQCIVSVTHLSHSQVRCICCISGTFVGVFFLRRPLFSSLHPKGVPRGHLFGSLSLVALLTPPPALPWRHHRALCSLASGPVLAGLRMSNATTTPFFDPSPTTRMGSPRMSFRASSAAAEVSSFNSCPSTGGPGRQSMTWRCLPTPRPARRNATIFRTCLDAFFVEPAMLCNVRFFSFNRAWGPRNESKNLDGRATCVPLASHSRSHVIRMHEGVIFMSVSTTNLFSHLVIARRNGRLIHVSVLHEFVWKKA